MKDINLEKPLNLSGSILLLGGTGFIGKSILDFLNQFDKKSDLKIIIVSRGIQKSSFDISKWSNLNLNWIKKSINDLKPDDLKEQVDYVIHAATSTNSEAQNLSYLIKTLIFGTLNIIDLCTKLKPQGVLYISSGAVYGLKRNGPPSFKETDLFAPHPSDLSESYGNFKRLNETLWTDFYQNTRIPTSIARCFAFSGKNLEKNSHFAICNFIRDAKNSDQITISGNGTAVRTYLDEKDLANWLLTIMLKNHYLDVVNVGSDQEITIKELAQKVQTVFPNLKLNILNNQEFPQNFYVPDISKARERYGLEQTVSFDESLIRMIDLF